MRPGPLGLPWGKVVLHIERSWGKYPGWFSEQGDDAQWDLLGDYLTDRDPRVTVAGVAAGLASPTLTGVGLLEALRALHGPGSPGDVPGAGSGPSGPLMSHGALLEFGRRMGQLQRSQRGGDDGG